MLLTGIINTSNRYVAHRASSHPFFSSSNVEREDNVLRDVRLINTWCPKLFTRTVTIPSKRTLQSSYCSCWPFAGHQALKGPRNKYLFYSTEKLKGFVLKLVLEGLFTISNVKEDTLRKTVDLLEIKLRVFYMHEEMSLFQRTQNLCPKDGVIIGLALISTWVLDECLT